MAGKHSTNAMYVLVLTFSAAQVIAPEASYGSSVEKASFTPWGNLTEAQFKKLA